MNNLKLLRATFIGFVILITSGVGCLKISPDKPTPAPTPIPMPLPEPTPTPTPKPNSKPYNADGTCPDGYVNYGVPLQCVTPEYMSYCDTHPCPICLAANTDIDTPAGPVAVRDMREGMPVWTMDKAGHRVAAVVVKTGHTDVPSAHQVVHLVLDDGRELYVSPGHPTIDGRTVADFTIGTLYDGSIVVSADLVAYDGQATYDILPSGETGFYWANGVLLDSTLHIVKK